MKFKVGDEVIKLKGHYTNALGVITAVDSKGNVQWRISDDGPFSYMDKTEWWNFRFFRKLSKLERALR